MSHQMMTHSAYQKHQPFALLFWAYYSAWITPNLLMYKMSLQLRLTTHLKINQRWWWWRYATGQRTQFEGTDGTGDDSLSSVTCGVQGHLTDVGRTITNAIKAEMQLHTSTGNWGTCLEKVHAYLMSIPVTSVEAERAFSAAGVLCTKLRSQLADNSIDTMCFLRSYYMKRRTCN